ncbi:MAG: cation:proton antiporter, partial [Planctomycetota bacterium]|nr:cation:proton antiporter [Planctomycetota bacterium]
MIELQKLRRQLCGWSPSTLQSRSGERVLAAGIGRRHAGRSPTMLLLKEVGGALVLGLSAGFATYYMLKRVDNYQVEVLLTLALGIYALTDAMHLSAPIAVVVAGLFVGNQGRALAMTEKTREHVDTFWELIDEILNAVLFLLIGLEILILPLEHQWLIAGSLAIPIVLFARWLSVAGIIGSLKWVSDQSKG